MASGNFFSDLLALIYNSLMLNTDALVTFAAQPNADILALLLAVLAGISRLVGDSVALFINRVSPRRFFIALLGGGVTFALELILWAFSIFVVARIFGAGDESLRMIFFIVAVASAPWLFGFLVFAPYLGALIRWLLQIWSWLIVLVLLRDAFALSLFTAFVTATVGWLLLRGAGFLFAARTEKMHAWWWTRLTGTPVELTFEEQADVMARQLRASEPRQVDLS